ncbi:MAG: hypothetical protein ACRCSF_11010 [Mycobacteriaceae bacterium]
MQHARRAAALLLPVVLAVTMATTPARANPELYDSATLAESAVTTSSTECLSWAQRPVRDVVTAVALQLRPQIPLEFTELFDRQITDFQTLIANTRVHRLALTQTPEALGGSSLVVDDPIVTYLVGSLARIKDGKQNEVVDLGHITVAQVIETLLLSTRIAQIPIQFTAELIAMFVSAAVGFTVDPTGGLVATIVSALTTLAITQPVSLAYMGITLAVRSVQKQLEGTCSPDGLVTPEVNPEVVGNAEQELVLPVELLDLARSLSIADGTCTPVAHLNLAEIIDRTASSVRAQVPEENLEEFDNQVLLIRDFIAANRVAVLALPEQPENVGILGTVLGVVTPGGSPVGNYLAGMIFVLTQGRGSNTVAWEEVTTVNALDLTLISLVLTNYLMNIAGGLIIPAAPGLPSPIAVVLKFVFAPATIGLPILKNVMKSVCLVEEDNANQVAAES